MNDTKILEFFKNPKLITRNPIIFKERLKQLYPEKALTLEGIKKILTNQESIQIRKQPGKQKQFNNPSALGPTEFGEKIIAKNINVAKNCQNRAFTLINHVFR